MKWCLVAAGVNDLKRPAEKLSVSQNLGASSLPFVMSSVSKQNDLQSLYSFGRYWYDLGTLLSGHHPHQLLFGRGMLAPPVPYFSTCSYTHVTKVNGFVGLTGLIQLYRIWE